MNSLSWLIYLGYAAGNLRELFFALTVFSLLGYLAGIGIMSINADDFRRPKSRWLLIPATAAFLAATLPTKEVVYAIAASEVGQKIIQNEKVQGMADDATTALQLWIKRQIQPPKKGE